jgi:hypothetical protein
MGERRWPGIDHAKIRGKQIVSGERNLVHKGVFLFMLLGVQGGAPNAKERLHCLRKRQILLGGGSGIPTNTQATVCILSLCLGRKTTLGFSEKRSCRAHKESTRCKHNGSDDH